MDSVSVSAEKDALKEKMRSYSTLNTLYHETLQEMNLLNKEIYIKDNIITDLKARLGTYERIYMTVGDQESVTIGPSKSLLESLCQEICKLKQKTNETKLKADQQAEEIQRLHEQLRETERELDTVRCQPDHEKDHEIQRLRSALQEKERVEATQVVLCNSLAEEADQLRGQLGATVKVCQELLSRLDRENKEGGGKEQMVQQQKAKETTEPTSTTGVHTQICQLQEENRLLKQRVSYVEGLNSKWQKYDSSREEYIRGLCQRLKDTTGHAGSGTGGAASDLKPGLFHQEISRLNGLLDEKMRECMRLRRDTEDVRRRDRERIQTLEQQVLIYTEDFKSERTDRERAQGQIEDLKEEIEQLKQQLHKPERRQPSKGTNVENREVVPLCRVHIGHRIAPRRHKEMAERLLRSSGDAQKQPAATTVNPDAAWGESQGLSELQCPRCLTTFSEQDAAEYLNHCEECAKL
ncbi:TNFAIP3-interacting protein 2 [Thalassophryne amazonica]|uniref:TNFAIP3-interacting protein 2 n=1 Tax=Thalassophryne amazonica TaxID=390379 RepID=UPI001472537C|nr:TNFAIP3-interacting protein 2 [Thalassophryne amazonica]